MRLQAGKPNRPPMLFVDFIFELTRSLRPGSALQRPIFRPKPAQRQQRNQRDYGKRDCAINAPDPQCVFFDGCKVKRKAEPDQRC
jgi:hypothetical protein